jgi:hypothetical protein
MSFSTIFRRAAVAPAFSARSFSTTTARPLAKITIVGNLADTPEVHPTSTGREIVRYAVASNSGSRENRKTSWFKVTSFAEGASRDYLMSLPKGYDKSQLAIRHIQRQAILTIHTVLPSTSRATLLSSLTLTPTARTAQASALSSVCPPSQFDIASSSNMVQAKSRFFDAPKLPSRASKHNPWSIRVHIWMQPFRGATIPRPLLSSLSQRWSLLLMLMYGCNVR